MWVHRCSGPIVEDRGGVLGPLGRHKALKRAPLLYPIFSRLFFCVQLSSSVDVAHSANHGATPSRVGKLRCRSENGNQGGHEPELWECVHSSRATWTHHDHPKLLQQIRRYRFFATKSL